MRSVRPSSVQVWKYQYTVSHGGKSCGSWRHEQPVRFRYKIASTIERRGWVAGRPPGRGSTIGAINSHCASVRSDGYDSGSHAHIVNHIDHMSHISHAGAPPAFTKQFCGPLFRLGEQPGEGKAGRVNVSEPLMMPSYF